MAKSKQLKLFRGGGAAGSGGDDGGPDFDGGTYERRRDHSRLNAQLDRVRRVLRDYAWHTLANISALTGDPQASVSARLRDLRKPKFGGHIVERRYLHDGLWEYRLLPPAEEVLA